MKLKIVERPALQVVGMAIQTRPMSPDIPELWPRFMARAQEIAGQAEAGVTYGVMRMEPGPAEVLHYMAAMAVNTPGQAPPGMTRAVIPAGTYAAFCYPLSELGRGFAEIFHELLPRSGYLQVGGQPLFERYGEAFDPGDPASGVDIFIPVRR